MLGKTIEPELKELIGRRDFVTLREILQDLLVPDSAELIAELPMDERAVVFRLLPQRLSAETFEHLDQPTQHNLLRALARAEVVAILNDMHPDDRTAFLESLPGQVVRELISQLTPPERDVARSLLGYPEASVGRLMTPDYVTVHPEWTVEQVLLAIREHGRDSETLNVLYVVDEKGVLQGDLRIREILLAQPDAVVSSLMNERFAALRPGEDQETAVGLFRKYGRVALPVEDEQGVLVGIVTIDDVLHVAEAEHTEDLQRFGGMESLEEPYGAVPLFTMVRKRAGWLVILFLSEMLTATAMGFFESEIARAVVLALFVPLIISSGGNSGSQAATLVIRALALGELTPGAWWRVMRREVLSGLALGLILGSIGFLRIAVWSAFGHIYGEHWALVGLTVGVSLVGVVLWGTLTGSMLPLLLRRWGADPATSSAPFVATLVDVTGLIIYFGVASLVLAGTVL
jgi:magnesium transporter